MANGNAYENPSQLYGPENVALMAQTMSRYRQQMAQSQEMLSAALQRRRKQVKENRNYMDRIASPFSEAYAEAKRALTTFTDKVEDSKEGLGMQNQIQNALKVVGDKLNETLNEIGPNGSALELQTATADAVAEVTALKQQLEALTLAHQEWSASKDLAPGDKKAILASSDPQLQLLFQRMDNGRDDIILQQDPANPMNWLFIPLTTEEDIKKESERNAPILKELEKKKADALQADPNADVTAIDERIKRLTDKNARTAGNYSDYYDDEGQRTDKEYKYDKTIGIVELGKIYKKGIEKGGEYFKHVEDVEENDFQTKHREIMQKNPNLFASKVQERKDGKTTLVDSSLAPSGSDTSKQRMYDKGQIADYYLNKGGKVLLDTYINEDNLEGQLEGLIGGYADDYYMENSLQTGEFKDFNGMSAEEMKSEIKYFMLQNLFDSMPDFYDTSTTGALGDELNTEGIEAFNTANQTTFEQ